MALRPNLFVTVYTNTLYILSISFDSSIKDAFELDTCSNKWDEREKSSHVILCWLFQSSSQVNNSNFVTDTLARSSSCCVRTLDNAVDRTCIFAAFFCCCNYFHRTGTVLRGEAQKPGGERVKSRRLSNLIRVFMFVYPRSFDLTTGRLKTLDSELQSCKVRRKVSTENARDRAYLSISVLSDKNSTFSVHNTHFPLQTSCYSGIVLQKM